MAKRRVFGMLDVNSVDSIGDIPGLQTALDNKSPVSHTHLGSEIAGGNPTFTNFVTPPYAILDTPPIDINPANGAIQTWILGANRTPTATSFSSGASVTMHISKSNAAYDVTWSTIGVVWIDGIAATIPTSGKAVIVMYKVGSVVYGTKIGEVS